MKRITFASAAYDRKGKVGRRERLLSEMDQVIPWGSILALIEPHYPKGRQRHPTDADAADLLHAAVVQPVKPGVATIPCAPQRAGERSPTPFNGESTSPANRDAVSRVGAARSVSTSW